ncbi:MAG TPA: acetyltransferase [Cyclobacteriaceae bacterium]|jgi:sugar O-acyltransferase (sialic acid O-acetyltransferase NeuD family)|nr:acetyltransferase [Cyclobacteriaceae bacterium]
MKPLVIFGTGDIASLANYYFQSDSEYIVEAFTVDRKYLQSSFEGKPVVAFEDLSRFYPSDKYDLFIALSYKNLNRVREAKYRVAKAEGYSLASYISSKCTYLSQFAPGDNCFILENNTIQPFVQIGSNITLWSGNHVGHHSIIDDHNFVSSHVVISGHCHIESNCFLGVNATLHNGVRIAKNNVIGAGAVISKSTRESEVYLPQRSSLFTKKSDEINL